MAANWSSWIEMHTRRRKPNERFISTIDGGFRVRWTQAWKLPRLHQLRDFRFARQPVGIVTGEVEHRPALDDQARRVIEGLSVFRRLLRRSRRRGLPGGCFPPRRECGFVASATMAF